MTRETITRASIGLLAGLLTACGGAPPVRASIAVLPVAWRTPDPLPALDEREPLVAGLSRVETLEVQTPTPAAPCEAEDADCARAAGGEAEHVLMASMASLGETVLTRVTLIDVEGGTQEQSQQRVLHDVDEAHVRAALEELGAAVGEPFAPEGGDTLAVVLGTGAAVAVAAGIATAIAVAATTGDNGPDFTVVPP